MAKAIKHLSFFEKILKLISTDPWLIVASLTAFITWSVEKVTIDEHNQKIADFNRMENLINQSLFGIRILEMQENQTLQNKQLYGKDTIRFGDEIFNTAKNKILQTNETWLELNVLANENMSDDDHSLAWSVREEKLRRDRAFEIPLSKRNFDTLRHYNDSVTYKFSKEATELQKKSQETLNDLNKKSTQNRNLYITLYVLSGIFFTIDRISKIK